MKWSDYVILPLLAGTVLVIAIYHYRFAADDTVSGRRSGPIPDFKSYTNVLKKKSDYFNYMLPMVREANSAVLKDRTFVRKIVANGSHSDADNRRLLALLVQYKLAAQVTPSQLEKLLLRTDVVPAALILAQSANESAWGTSRFALDANNFFGLWCFKKGCGLTPRNRDEGLVHEVARFDSVADGVAYYIHTINTHGAYRRLRNIRSQLRRAEQPITGSELAEGLIRYSERGIAYVEEIQAMIRINNLSQFNRGG